MKNLIKSLGIMFSERERERETDCKDIKIFLNVFIVYWFHGTGEVLSISFVHCCRCIFTNTGRKSARISLSVRIPRAINV